MRVSACSTSCHTNPFNSSSEIFSSFSCSKQLQFRSGRARVRLKRPYAFRVPKLRFCRNSYSNGAEVSPWDEKPYELSPTGKKMYIDELDVATFLDPPKELIPLDPASYNPATYLWKKISDIPEDRRHRLLRLLKPRHVSRMWAVAGTRYGDPKLLKRSASDILSLGGGMATLEFWNCQTDKVPISLAWMKNFNKVLFHAKDGSTCGRMFPGGPILQKIMNSWCPCYLRVSNVKEIMPTEQPCDLAYEFEEGLLDAHLIPEGFPAPAKHPWPLNDQVVVYVRHAGPGVMVGQAWQEGKILEQVPRKFCEEILLVKDYYVVSEAS